VYFCPSSSTSAGTVRRRNIKLRQKNKSNLRLFHGRAQSLLCMACLQLHL
jgi:hypothetical protein